MKKRSIMIQITGVTKKLDKFSIKDISLEIPDGYITGVIGLNGAGKTTLFHLMLGLYVPDQGEIVIDGMKYADQERAIREKTGVVLQERLFEEYETLEGNAAMYGRYYGNYQDGKMHGLMQQFGLNPKQKYKTLSKGEELKFQFAFALAHNPKLLLLDDDASEQIGLFTADVVGLLNLTLRLFQRHPLSKRIIDQLCRTDSRQRSPRRTVAGQAL